MKDQIVNVLLKLIKLNKDEIENLLETPPSPELGDYAFPCFILAKKLKKNPHEVASFLAKKIKSKNFEKVQAKGPYINFFLDSSQFTKESITLILKKRERYGKQKIKSKVLIESPGPNTNKPLHIGHARNIILAQSLKKILEFQGNHVQIVNIVNDRGFHICKSLVAYEKFGNDLTPEKAKRKSDFFVGDFYVRYTEEAKKNPDLEREVRQCLQRWEAEDKQTIKLWKKMNSWAYKGFNETYKKFNFKTDKDYYESNIYKKGRDLVFEQFKKGNVIRKEGAYIANLGKKLGEKVLLRSDGTSIYITQDIYLALLRKKDFNFDKMIYVVGNEQNYHFEVLFELLKLFGYKWAKDLVHLNYGLVHLESGRMKSREGTVVDSDELISNLESLSLKELTLRYRDLPKKELEKRAKTIAMAALRYYFLKLDRAKDVLFRPEESINFEGNTGPYLLYTYARAKSILRKAKYRPQKEFLDVEIDDTEKSLLLLLRSFPLTAKRAYESLAPNLIANYTYDLAKKFNEWYHSHKVIGSENEKFRLLVVDATLEVLKRTFSLLAINTLEEM